MTYERSLLLTIVKPAFLLRLTQHIKKNILTKSIGCVDTFSLKK